MLIGNKFKDVKLPQRKGVEIKFSITVSTNTYNNACGVVTKDNHFENVNEVFEIGGYNLLINRGYLGPIEK